MQSNINKKLLVSALLLALTPIAQATNGMAPTGVGQVHKAMGGTAVANPENTMTLGTNPAAGSFIADGFDVGLEIFKPDRSATLGTNVPGVGVAGSYDGNGVSAFPVPEGGYNRTLANGVSLGLAVYGNGGMNTEYEPAFTGAPSGAAGIDFKQVFISPTVSKKIGDNHSVGLSLNFVGQAFKSQGLLGPGSTGTDTATGVGASIGYLGKISPKAMVGISHRFKTSMGGFDDNTPLFANATTPRDATGAPTGAPTVADGKMDVPGATTIGLSFDVTPKTKVALDLQRIYYSKVAAIHDGFGWEDQDVVKVGVKHQLNNKVALLGGFNYGESVVTPQTSPFGNIIAPAVVESHLSLGAEIKLKKKSKLSVVYVHAFDKEVKRPADMLGNTVDVKMKQNSLGVGYSREF